MNSSEGTNPFQSPQEIVNELDPNTTINVSFPSFHCLSRHAVDQYLLRQLGVRLLFGSLVMILASTGAIVYTQNTYGTIAAIPTLISCLLLSSAIYLVMVFRTKKLVVQNLSSFDFDDDEFLSLEVTTDRILLKQRGESHEWSCAGSNAFRTRRGLLICPEPLTYIFVPKQSFKFPNFIQSVDLIKTRTRKG